MLRVRKLMRFTKMQGIGNDFVVLNGDELLGMPNFSSLAITLCDRHFGVGADGLLVLSHKPAGRGVPFAMRMFNPDGTEDMCGNGLRCAVLWACRANWLAGQAHFDVMTKDGARSVRIIETANAERSAQIGVDMGAPFFAPPDLPFGDTSVPTVFDYPLHVADRTFSISTTYTGSTHTVIFGDVVDEETFQRYSPLIETHPLFPERTTVMWTTVRGINHLDVRIWERGVGETLGCGTGACAVAVSAVQHGFVPSGVPVDVVSKGGILSITWGAPNGDIDMVGPATVVFDGDFALES